jgi:hypothetical protein
MGGMVLTSQYLGLPKAVTIKASSTSVDMKIY